MSGCLDGQGLSPEATKFLQDYFHRAAGWWTGAYTRTLRVNIVGQVDERPFSLVLNQPEIARLQAMQSHLSQCRGLMSWPQQLCNLSDSDPTASNALPVQLSWQCPPLSGRPAPGRRWPGARPG